ncbi:hypothetical protein [Nonomuraea sp. NPDC023979]|uniref:hypothetical protein n=1 Tax=Nonomuraea sp. NPDC023979 TaxID=3154796 RepID=UPI0033EE1489
MPVESAVDGEVLAALCPGCDRQLPAEFLTCPHDNVIDTPSLSQPPGLGICNDCGTSAWFGRRTSDAGMVATLVAAGWEPASARRAVESKDFTLLAHTAFERPQAVISCGQDVSIENAEALRARFLAAQKEPYRLHFAPTIANVSTPTPGEIEGGP